MAAPAAAERGETMASRSVLIGRRAAVAVAAALAVGLVPSSAGAVPGEPVPTFAGDGALELLAGQRTVTTDDQGRILVATGPTFGTGPTTVQRFTAAGAPDTTFSGDGAVDLPSSGAPYREPFLFPDDGGVRVGVWTAAGFESWSLDGGGVPDPAYGAGGRSLVPPPDTSSAAPNLVDAVPVGDGLAVVWKEGDTSRIDALDRSGQPRSSFGGGDGSVDGPALASHVAARPGGGLVITTPTGLLAVAADGTLGTPVALTGHGTPTGLVVDAQDRVLLTAGAPGDETVLRRFTSTLQVDAAYGTGGSIALPGTGPTIRTVDGRWYVVSSIADGPSPSSPSTGYRSRVWIALLDGAGALDPGFGTGGVLTVQDVHSEGVLTYYRDAPIVALAPAPAGGLAVGMVRHYGDASVSGSQTWDDVRQFSAAGGLVATLNPPVHAVSVTDGGDDGATFLGLLDTPAPGGVARLARFELQQPATPGAPGRPSVTAVDGATFQLAWTAAAGSPTRYVVSAFEPGAGTAAVTVEVTGSQRSAALTVPHTGRPYRFDVYATAGSASGARSTPSPFTMAPFPSMTGFVARLHADVPSWRTTPETRAAAAEHLAAYGGIDEVLIEVAYQRQFRLDTDPVTRIYTASFGRLPDSEGLRYWVGKRRAGVTVARIAAQFAASREFQRTYGKLSDRAFVALVYQNVLGRPADPGGLDYWSARLAAKKISRGQLMASFSESAEHVRKLDETATAVRSYLFVLGRAPRSAEVTAWLASDELGGDKIAALLESAEYAARVG